ncbi:MAG TPA: Gfo/Idh/MocA family oxidoreductase [Candidatus Hydrogenedentes bacterium]|nr:Gfo/Idh/MocA family oxidoreductase [Candidatus Hydrogenedentota bacterium]HQM99490.1 Gfo/Idh/MocA family oxidoreductase [Candidatus Hydrogenedentota bacterium]
MNRRGFLAGTAAAAATAAFGREGVSEAGPSRRYRACIIGDSKQGGYGHSLHLVWALRDDVEIVGLSDPDEAGRARHAWESGAQRTYADYRDMLDKERPDLVAIGPRWTVNHRDYLMACAEAGAHGMLEKPLTPDLAAADEVHAAMEARHLKWAIAFNFRASPEMALAKRLIFEEGIIGEVLEVRARGKEDRRAGGEDLIVLGVHLFDALIYFLGRPSWCASTILTEGHPAGRDDIREATESLGPIVGDTLYATFGFKSGIPAYFASMKNPETDSGRYGMNIYGSRGMATIRMDTYPMTAYIEDPSWSPVAKDVQWKPLPGLPGASSRKPEQVAHYAPIVDDLIKAVEQDRRPAVSLLDGLYATEMIQAIWEAPLHGGRVDMPLKERSHPLTRW